MLGRAKKVMIEKENTTIVNGAGKKAAIEARISQIKAQIEVAWAVLVAQAGLGPSAVGSARGASLRTCRYLLISMYTSLRTRLMTPSGLCSGKQCQGLNDKFSQKVARSEHITFCLGMMIFATCSGFEIVSVHTILVFSIGVLSFFQRSAEGKSRKTRLSLKGVCSSPVLRKTSAQRTSSTSEGNFPGPTSRAWRCI